ncbi:MAG: MFS transporter [candidate division Zixibacteria bacterium]
MKYFKTKIFAWSLYDFANTIFSMVVVSLNFPLMIKSVYGGSDLQLSLSRSSAMVLVALTMPLLGKIADKFGRRMPPVMVFTVLCCLATVSLGRSDSMIVNLIIFAIAVYCFQGALVFYNAVLPQVAGPKKMGRVSGYGVALGYGGTIFGLIAIGFLVGSKCYSDAFTLAAVLFLLFSIPFFIVVRDQFPRKLKNLLMVAKESMIELAGVYGDAKSRPGILRFLLGRFFVVEALETIIFFMAVFLKEGAGFSDRITVFGNLTEIYVYLIIVTVFTALGSLGWGFVTERFGPKRSLLAIIVLWIITLTGIILFKDKAVLYFLGSLAGISLGGVWTSERPLLVNLVADDSRLAGYFGLFAFSGRMAAVAGPVIWGLIVLYFDSYGPEKYNFAIGSVLAMMIVGLFILRKVPDAR